MRALWIEDHRLIGDSLEVLLQVVMPELSLDKAGSLDMAVGRVLAIPYELVLLDWWLGNSDGETSIRTLRGCGCRAPIIVVSGDERLSIMDRAAALGIAAYVPKTAEPAHLIDAIRRVVIDHDHPPVDELPAARPGPVEAPHWIAASGPVEPDRAGLTPRQTDVFRGLVRGLSDKQIARELGVSETTVKTHVRGILQALDVHKRGEAVFKAQARGHLVG